MCNDAPWLLPWDNGDLIHALMVMGNAAKTHTGVSLRAVELHVLRDGPMATENRRCMGCPGPTNVLAFPGGDDMSGVLLISADMLHRECLLYGQKPEGHLVRVLAHGMGHLYGLNHGSALEALCTRMREPFTLQRVFYGQ